MISIDGMMPSTYTGTDLKVPTIRSLKGAGRLGPGRARRRADADLSVAHHASITGVVPALHGVIDNRIVDPENLSNTGWYWYAEAIRVPTLPGVLACARPDRGGRHLAGHRRHGPRLPDPGVLSLRGIPKRSR